jgi:hypothetical protein
MADPAQPLPQSHAVSRAVLPTPFSPDRSISRSYRCRWNQLWFPGSRNVKHFSRDWRTFVPGFSRTAAAGVLGLVLSAPMGLAACTVVERPHFRGYHHQSFGPDYRRPVVVVPAPRSHDDHGHHDRRHQHH